MAIQIGYDPKFIGDGINIPLPTFNRSLGQSVRRRDKLRKRQYSDHEHFTIVMHEDTRQLIYSAYNIDQSKFLQDTKGKGEKSWSLDSNYLKAHQLNNNYYNDREDSNGDEIPNPYDRGHMVMRYNNMWGTEEEADLAGKATFIYSNA